MRASRGLLTLPSHQRPRSRTPIFRCPPNLRTLPQHCWPRATPHCAESVPASTPPCSPTPPPRWQWGASPPSPPLRPSLCCPTCARWRRRRRRQRARKRRRLGRPPRWRRPRQVSSMLPRPHAPRSTSTGARWSSPRAAPSSPPPRAWASTVSVCVWGGGGGAGVCEQREARKLAAVCPTPRPHPTPPRSPHALHASPPAHHPRHLPAVSCGGGGTSQTRVRDARLGRHEGARSSPPFPACLPSRCLRAHSPHPCSCTHTTTTRLPTPVHARVQVQTDTPKVQESIVGVLSLLKANHKMECDRCDVSGRCEFQVRSAVRPPCHPASVLASERSPPPPPHAPTPLCSQDLVARYNVGNGLPRLRTFSHEWDEEVVADEAGLHDTTSGGWLSGFVIGVAPAAAPRVWASAAPPPPTHPPARPQPPSRSILKSVSSVGAASPPAGWCRGWTCWGGRGAGASVTPQSSPRRSTPQSASPAASARPSARWAPSASAQSGARCSRCWNPSARCVCAGRARGGWGCGEVVTMRRGARVSA